MKVYLAGPMTGYPLFNFPAFKEAREKLRAAGYEVICPAEEDEKEGFDPANPEEITPDQYEAWIDRDLGFIHDCDALVYMPGSEQSNGASREIMFARLKKMPVMSLEKALKKTLVEYSLTFKPSYIPYPFEAEDATQDALTAAQIDILDVCEEVKALLIEKNRAYGNSALNPVRIFSKADTQEKLS